MNYSSRDERSAGGPFPGGVDNGDQGFGVGDLMDGDAAGSTNIVSLLMLTLRRWWKQALPAGVALVILGSVALLAFWRPVYQASAWMRIERTSPYVAFQTNQVVDKDRVFEQTQLQLIESPMVLGRVVTQPRFASWSDIQEAADPIEWLADELRIDWSEDSELFEMSFQGENPEQAASIVNAVVDAYFQLQNERNAARTKRVLQILRDEQRVRGLEVDRLRRGLVDYLKEITADDPEAARTQFEAEQIRRDMGNAKRQLETAELERAVTEARLKADDSAITEGTLKVPEYLIDQSVDQQPEVATVIQAIGAARYALSDIESSSAGGRESSGYRRALREVKRHEDDLVKIRTDVRDLVADNVKRQYVNQRKAEVEMMKANVESLRVSESLLRDRYAKQQLAFTDFSNRMITSTLGLTDREKVKIDFLKTELAREQRTYEQIAGRALAMETEMGAPDRVTLLSPATASESPVEALPYRWLALIGVFGMALPFGAAVAWEVVSKRVGSSGELSRARIQVAGEVATLPVYAKGGRRSRSLQRELAMFQESVDCLRATLLHSNSSSDIQVIAVSSAVGNEGKTSLAAQLAISIASSSGEKTLLVDADMRVPDLHRLFDMGNDRGLANVLEGTAEIRDTVMETPTANLDLLAAGRIDGSHQKFMGSDDFPKLIEKLRSEWRYIIVDTPPILSASEAVLVAKAADTTLLCTMRDVSRLGQVKQAYDRLAATLGRPARAVLNGMPFREYARAYGKYPVSAA